MAEKDESKPGDPVATAPLERTGPPADGETPASPAAETATTTPSDASEREVTSTGPEVGKTGPPVADHGDPMERKKKRFGIFPRRDKPPKSRRSRIISQIAELPLLILVAFLIAVVIKTFIMQAFYIPSGSMKPTLQVGDRVLVEKVTNWFGGPGYGDVVVFARDVFPGRKGPDVPWYSDAKNYVRELLGLPTGQEEDYIKRVVALGGDTIRYEGSPRELIVNDEKVDEDYLPKPDNSSSSITASNCPAKMKESTDGCVVPAGSVFVMGDNRDNSADSRSIGPVDEEKIVGRAFVIIWPPSDFGTL
jgi:signal peptidase I